MKNWTLRQRILASFAVIIAIMLLMIVAAYSRLVTIETAEEAVGTDSIPGVYYSSMIRSAWVDSYVTSQQRWACPTIVKSLRPTWNCSEASITG